MKRNTILAIAISLIVTALAYSFAAFWIGKSAEENIQKKIAWIKTQPYTIVKSHSYHRGWFSSDAVTVIDLSPGFYQLLAERLGQTNKPGEFAFTYKQHITHGPFPLLTSFNLLPYQAATSTEFIFPDKLEKFLTRFFGKTQPIQIKERIAFNGDTQSNFSIAGLNHDEAISGIKIKWSGFDGKSEYSSDLKSRFNLSGLSEKLSIDLPSKHFSMDNFSLNMNKFLGKTGVMLGSELGQIDTFHVKFNDNNPFELKLNKIGGGYSINEAGEYINGESKLNIASFTLNQKTYGPVRFLAEAKHLYAPAVLGLTREIQQIHQNELTDEQVSTKLLAAYQEDGATLLAHNPQIGIRELFVHTPDGDIKMQAKIALNGVVKTDLNEPLTLWHKITANADIVIPRKVLEAILAFQTQKLLLGEEQEVNQDTVAFIRQLVEAQINQLIQDRYIQIEGSNVVSTVALKNGNLILNGKPLSLN